MSAAAAHAGGKKNIRLAVGLMLGKLCRSCPGRDLCKDVPTEQTPILVECPGCGGDGCPDCRDGRIEIAQCPMELADAKMFELVRFSRAMETGLLPEPGALLDQAQAFLEAAWMVKNEWNLWENYDGKNKR